MTEIGDEALLAAWQAGDKAAGDVLVRRYFSLLFRFLKPRVAEHTADLAQRTFLAISQSHERIPGGVSFRAWLLGVARNQLLAFGRASARRSLVVGGAPISGVAGDATPSEVVAHREEQRVLLRGLRTLPIEMQLVIELFYWENMSREEIAAVLSVETNTVKSRLQRAKDRLRELLPRLDPVTGSVTAADLERWAQSLRPPDSA